MRKRELLDLRYDASFKALFERDEELLLDFINSVIEDRAIKSIIELNTNIKPVDITRGIIFDILVRDENDNKINIEMEKHSSSDMKKRTQFYWAKAFTRGLNKSLTFNVLTNTICINVLGKNIFKDDKYKRKYTIYDAENNQRLDESLEIYFVELEKVDSVDLMDRLSMWAKLIKNSNDIEDIEGKDAIIDKAITKAEELSMDDEVATRVLKEQQEEFELRSKLEESKRLGREEGREKGREEGREEGLRIALDKLLLTGMGEGQAKQLLGIK